MEQLEKAINCPLIWIRGSCAVVSARFQPDSPQSPPITAGNSGAARRTETVVWEESRCHAFYESKTCRESCPAKVNEQ